LNDATNELGAIRPRRTLIEGIRTVGLECTFAVDDLDATAQGVRDAGGTIVMERFKPGRCGRPGA
jgi:predicted enzyme related to lactoylglutathione lyase